jgi:hypothetical protein
VAEEMTERIRALGPSPLKGSIDRQMEDTADA